MDSQERAQEDPHGLIVVCERRLWKSTERGLRTALQRVFKDVNCSDAPRRAQGWDQPAPKRRDR